MRSTVGIAKNHAFVDGNKRAAFLSIGLFLGLNGKRLRVDQVDAIQTILALAAGTLDEHSLASWISKPRVGSFSHYCHRPCAQQKINRSSNQP
jgi:death on curing protein